MKTITVIELNDINGYPPVQTLIRVLLNKGYKVNLIGRNITKISADISENKSYVGYETAKLSVINNKIQAAFNRLYMIMRAHKLLRSLGSRSDYIWTTSMKSVQILGKSVLKYKNILQLMELAENGYLVRDRYIKFPINKIAQRSWKTVVPEINRAYIQKAWWNLSKCPIVLPNKPFSIDFGNITDELESPIRKMQAEKRKILLYLGSLELDRDIETLAVAIRNSKDYVLYIVGKVYSIESKKRIEFLEKKYNCVYVGGFDPPKHLAIVKYAHIGLLPYRPTRFAGLSILNALYCAPNKIWEYSGFGVPMVGSDVLGLKLPFEQWNIGRCCDMNDESSIIKAIEEVDRNHDEMSDNCYKFFDSVDLGIIVSDILEDYSHIQCGGVIRRNHIYSVGLSEREAA